MQVSKQRPRHRATSDPFNDPTAITSYSAYGVPTLTRNAPPQNSLRPPPPPPKSSPPRSTPRRNPTASSPNRENLMEAARDTVIVRSSDQTPRNKMGRSNTELPAPAQNLKTTLPPPTRRSHSQDSVLRAANTVEKAKASGRPRGTKKGSTHADVIDRLDFSGVGPMFHHDGPFDACAPSRNRHRTKAPMLAWTSGAEADKNALAAARDVNQTRYESPYPTSPNIYVPYEAPKKTHDVIAEAWGIHEPEPFEDFSAGGGYSARPSPENHSNSSSRNGNSKRTKDGREAREVYRQYLDDGRRTNGRRQQVKRSTVPPPQPIFVPESEIDIPQPPSPGSPGAPKRNKSLMGRIRKMRDAPNVPATYDDDARIVAGGYGRDPSPPSSAENSNATHASQPARPTHRSQNSFLGRFGRSGRGENNSHSPTDEAYVYVDDASGVPLNKEKSLPATPARGGDYSGGGGYFDPNAAMAGSPDSGGLARKTSLLRKVRGVVRGGAK